MGFVWFSFNELEIDGTADLSLLSFLFWASVVGADDLLSSNGASFQRTEESSDSQKSGNAMRCECSTLLLLPLPSVQLDVLRPFFLLSSYSLVPFASSRVSYTDVLSLLVLRLLHRCSYRGMDRSDHQRPRGGDGGGCSGEVRRLRSYQEPASEFG